MMKREKGGITWSDVGKDPKEQCRSQHGGCALPCHPLSSQAPLVKMLLLYLLACAYASLQNSVLVALMKQTAAHSPPYIAIYQCLINITWPNNASSTDIKFFHGQHRHYFNLTSSFFSLERPLHFFRGSQVPTHIIFTIFPLFTIAVKLPRRPEPWRLLHWPLSFYLSSCPWYPIKYNFSRFLSTNTLLNFVDFLFVKTWKKWTWTHYILIIELY